MNENLILQLEHNVECFQAICRNGRYIEPIGSASSYFRLGAKSSFRDRGDYLRAGAVMTPPLGSRVPLTSAYSRPLLTKPRPF